VKGNRSGGIVLHSNDLRKAKVPFRLDRQVKASAVRLQNNIIARK
jgi:hypothetical protein